MGAAVLRGRRAERAERPVPLAEPGQALDPSGPQVRKRQGGAGAPGYATPTCCSSRSGPACSTGSASGTSAFARRTPRSSTARSPATDRTGPARDRPGHDLNYLGLNGILGLSGEADGPPVPSAAQIADLGGGALMAAFGIMTALRGAPALGRGTARRLLDVRRLAVVARDARRRDAGRRSRSRDGASSSCPAGSSATGRTVRRRLTSRSARSSRSSGPSSAGGSDGRTCSSNAFDPPGSDAHREVCEIIAARTREEWRAFASEHDCCLEPVMDLDEVLGSDLVAAREMVVELDQPGAERPVKLLGLPVQAEPHAGRPGTRSGPRPRRAHARGPGARPASRLSEIDALHESGAVAGPAAETVQGSFMALRRGDRRRACCRSPSWPSARA